MDISSVSMPAFPEPQPQPPRDAVAQNAVREASQSEPENNDSNSDQASSDAGQRRNSDSNLGKLVDERV